MSTKSVTRFRWDDMPGELVSPGFERRLVTGERAMLAQALGEGGEAEGVHRTPSHKDQVTSSKTKPAGSVSCYLILGT